MNEEIKIGQKKNKSFATFLLCIAFLLFGAGGMYYLIGNNKTVNHEKNTDESNLQTLNPNGVLVKELISRLDYNTDCGVNNNLYSSTKITIENLDQNYLSILVAKEANGKNINGTISFTKEEFDDSAKIIFGNDIVLASSNITGICPQINYDNINQRYTANITACQKNTCTYENQRYIIKAEKDNNNIYIYVAVAKVDLASKKVSNIIKPDSVIQDIDINTFDITTNYDMVNNYKYTYIYDEANNNYIFKSIELVK